MSEIPRKSPSAIANVVGLTNNQVLHHFLISSPWNVEALRNQILPLILQKLQGRVITLVINKTEDGRRENQKIMYIDNMLVN